MMISICEKMRLKQLRKAKYWILASILHISYRFFLTESFTYLYNTMGKSHDFLISCFESWHTSQKIWLFGKICFVIHFWTRSAWCLEVFYFDLIENPSRESVFFGLVGIFLKILHILKLIYWFLMIDWLGWFIKF